MSSPLEQAASAIQAASNLLITAGAGMGVDSGLPDFRGNEGFWRAYPALHGYPFHQMANPTWFEKDPTRAWGFYGHRLNLYRRTIPHEGFQILKRWAETRPYFIYTSNVDGAFGFAGFSSDHIVECHGSIHHLQRLNPTSRREIWSAESVHIEIDDENCRAVGQLPTRDGVVVRPNILMFGDWGWLSERTMSQGDRLREWLARTDLSNTVVVEMGAGTAIPTVREFGEEIQESGATLIRINPREAQGPVGTISIFDGAQDSLVAIDQLIH